MIHFLHAYANPAHELRAGEIARAIWPNDYVTLGHKLLSEYREYERGTTASVNAAVQPILDRYLRRLERDLEAEGFRRDLLVMNGNGGTVASHLVTRDAAKTVMSGPASGVTAAAATLKQSGIANAITYDMGGTSTDVALIHGGVPEVSTELTIAYGLPIHVPMVDVRTVGAGGGSIAWVNAAGMLQVGPESAGSTPGPVCYGRGGERATITDAHVVLGRLDASRFSGFAGEVAMSTFAPRSCVTWRSRSACRRRMRRRRCSSSRNTHMAGAIRMVSLSRGYDPRDFVLFAFGGAGPLHAVALARELGVPEVLVPARPGLTNALGCLVADLRQDFVNTLNVPLDALDMSVVAHTFAARRAEGEALNAAKEDEIVESVVLLRGRHAVPRPDAPDPRRHSLARRDARGAAGAVRGGVFRALPGAAAGDPRGAGEPGDVGDRKTKSVSGEGADRGCASRASGRRDADPRRNVGCMSTERWHEAQVFEREELAEGARIEGPAVIEQFDATTVIEPGACATIDAIGNLRIDVGSAP